MATSFEEHRKECEKRFITWERVALFFIGIVVLVSGAGMAFTKDITEIKGNITSIKEVDKKQQEQIDKLNNMYDDIRAIKHAVIKD